MEEVEHYRFLGGGDDPRQMFTRASEGHCPDCGERLIPSATAAWCARCKHAVRIANAMLVIEKAYDVETNKPLEWRAITLDPVDKAHLELHRRALTDEKVAREWME